MKIQNLEIIDFRGIKHILLSPQMNNMVIYGQNGSGKSGVVDSLDFLFTGKISRLSGPGTAGITVKKFGPHIDCKPETATVSATVNIAGCKENIHVTRCVATPNFVQVESKYNEILEPVFEVAQRGQQLLSRREILKYITADAKTRAEEIQNLLNISEIEVTRKFLMTFKNLMERDFQTGVSVKQTAKNAIIETTKLKEFSPDNLLLFVNELRKSIGLGELSILSSQTILTDLQVPKKESDARNLGSSLVTQDISYLQSNFRDSKYKQIIPTVNDLSKKIESIRNDKRKQNAISRANLYKLGVSLIPDSGECPLCDTEWAPGKLNEKIQEQLSLVNEAIKELSEVDRNCSEIYYFVSPLIEKLRNVIIQVEKEEDNQQFLPQLHKWYTELQEYHEQIDSPIDKFVISSNQEEYLKALIIPQDVKVDLDKLEEKYSIEKQSPEETAIGLLIRLFENLKAYEIAEINLNQFGQTLNRARKIYQYFLDSRAEVLQNLYSSICERFSLFYRTLHDIDEGNFSATISPMEAGINFEVDFYNRGKFNPQALHSEGHQDSMGLCLYLALAEKLLQGKVSVIVLDDVVMSVDWNHRRKVCKLINTYFKDFQFIITTHDKVWANQLRSEGVATSKNIIGFYDWNIDTGPIINYENDLWVRISEYITKNDIPNAAFLLRRGSEEFYSLVCESLSAKVEYKQDNKYELGELLSASINAYKSILSKAKQSAQSWGNKEIITVVGQMEDRLAKIVFDVDIEKWAVNSEVHFNELSQLSGPDFEPVVSVFKELQNLFICENCTCILQLSRTGYILQSLRCNCGKVNLNLVVKEKSK